MKILFFVSVSYTYGCEFEFLILRNLDIYISISMLHEKQASIAMSIYNASVQDSKLMSQVSDAKLILLFSNLTVFRYTNYVSFFFFFFSLEPVVWEIAALVRTESSLLTTDTLAVILVAGITKLIISLTLPPHRLFQKISQFLTSFHV